MGWKSALSTFTDLAALIVCVLLGYAAPSTWFTDSSYEPLKYVLLCCTSIWLLLMVVDSILACGCCCLFKWLQLVVKGLLVLTGIGCAVLYVFLILKGSSGALPLCQGVVNAFKSGDCSASWKAYICDASLGILALLQLVCSALDVFTCCDCFGSGGGQAAGGAGTGDMYSVAQRRRNIAQRTRAMWAPRQISRARSTSAKGDELLRASDFESSEEDSDQASAGASKVTSARVGRGGRREQSSGESSEEEETYELKSRTSPSTGRSRRA